MAATWEDILQVGSFGGVAFDFVSVSDDHSNTLDKRTFPNRPGQSIQPRARNGMRFEVMAIFIEDDYPEKMNDLIAQLDDGGVVKELVHPVFGSIKAACERFTVVHDVEDAADSATIRISFEEDTDGSAGPTKTVNTPPARANAVRSLGDTVLVALSAYTEALELVDNNPVSLEVMGAVNAATGMADSLEATGDSMSVTEVQSTANGALATVNAAIESLEDYESTEQYDLSAALKEMSDAMSQMATDLIEAKPPLTIYTVPAETNLPALVFDLYGDPTRIDEVLGLNSFPDPLAIVAGTKVQCYAE